MEKPRAAETLELHNGV